jgi:hypothetical protein
VSQHNLWHQVMGKYEMARYRSRKRQVKLSPSCIDTNSILTQVHPSTSPEWQNSINVQYRPIMLNLFYIISCMFGSILDPKYGGDMSLRNIGLPLNCTTLESTRPYPSIWRLALEIPAVKIWNGFSWLRIKYE